MNMFFCLKFNKMFHTKEVNLHVLFEILSMSIMFVCVHFFFLTPISFIQETVDLTVYSIFKMT